MQSYEFQPLFDGVIDMDLNALSHGGENSRETPQ